MMPRMCLFRIRFPLLALALMLLFCGCAKERSWRIGDQAPEISVLTLNEQTVKLSEFRGKPVVLRFWATGCKECVSGMPKLDRYTVKYREQGAAVLAVNMGGSKPLVEAFAKGLKLTYPVFLDPAQIASQKYGVRSVPTTFFIDRKGIARKVVVGETTEALIEQTMSELL